MFKFIQLTDLFADCIHEICEIERVDGLDIFTYTHTHSRQLNNMVKTAEDRALSWFEH